MTRPKRLVDAILPLYVQVAESLMERINAAELAPGDRLPAERILSQQLGVTRHTLRQALQMLESRGMLLRQRGTGTYVTDLKIERPSNRFVPFSRSVRRQGLFSSSRVLIMKQSSASLALARKLNLPPSAPVFILHRLHLVNQEPTMLERLSVPALPFPGLETGSLTSRCMYEVMEAEYDVRISSADQIIEAVCATEYEAGILGISVSSPLVLEQRIGYDQNSQPMVYAEDLYRGDRVRLVAKGVLRIDL